jgi:hypothetical protein
MRTSRPATATTDFLAANILGFCGGAVPAHLGRAPQYLADHLAEGRHLATVTASASRRARPATGISPDAFAVTNLRLALFGLWVYFPEKRPWGWAHMKDYRASIEKLRTDAAEAALIRDLATDPTKREMFNRLHEHLSRLADEVEQAMQTSKRSV